MDRYEALMHFGLTRQESLVYVALVTEGAMTGYEAAKKTGISRSNVYTTLAGLVDKGAAYLLEGTPVRYLAVPVEEFCDNRLYRMQQMKEYLVEDLQRLEESAEGYITIKGDQQIDDKIRHMLEYALSRIYVSGSYHFLNPYMALLKRRVEEGLKVVILTDSIFELTDSIIYYAERKPNQIGVIIDSSTVLTGDVGHGEQSTCLYSGKKTLVDLFKESLANEIKLIELTKKG